MAKSDTFEALRLSLDQKRATLGVIGLGYVGLPLAMAGSRGGFKTIGFDIDTTKTDEINAGRSYIDSVESQQLKKLVDDHRLEATSDFARLAECDVIIVCVPTPLDRHREPDLSYVEATGREIAKSLRAGQLVVLESTTYPGTTREILKPILEESGLSAGVDFFIGFSPEREDPGNTRYATSTIPKVVAGDGPEAAELVQVFYSAVVTQIVPVSSTDVAEATKITENVFRAVNIALVNELKVIYEAMDIDIWEIIDAAKTKPFGFMPFYPGPGLGGHCIPVDPFYLTWRSREFDVVTRFIELAGEINTAMPARVIEVLARTLDKRQARALSASRVLVIGLAYKKNVPDLRESPSFKLMELLEARGAEVDFHDPHVLTIPPTREHTEFTGRASVPLTSEGVASYDAVLIATDHDAVAYDLLAKAKLVIDTRNAMTSRGFAGVNLVKA